MSVKVPPGTVSDSFSVLAPIVVDNGGHDRLTSCLPTVRPVLNYHGCPSELQTTQSEEATEPHVYPKSLDLHNGRLCSEKRSLRGQTIFAVSQASGAANFQQSAASVNSQTAILPSFYSFTMEASVSSVGRLGIGGIRPKPSLDGRRLVENQAIAQSHYLSHSGWAGGPPMGLVLSQSLLLVWRGLLHQVVSGALCL